MRLLDQLDELQALEGIKRGLADVKAGRVTSVEDFEKRFQKEHGISRRSRAREDGRPQKAMACPTCLACLIWPACLLV